MLRAAHQVVIMSYSRFIILVSVRIISCVFRSNGDAWNLTQET